MNNESRSLENTLLILTQIGVEGDCLRNASTVNRRNYRIKVCTCEGCIQRCVQYSKSIRKEEVGLPRKSKECIFTEKASHPLLSSQFIMWHAAPIVAHMVY